MSKILCPTRGGAASYRTQDAAIAAARERGVPLIFLYVVDTHFLDHTHRAVRPDVVMEEMARMAEFLLAMAQERAEAQGVTAEVCLRHGEFKEELIAAVHAEGVSEVLLGRPEGDESTFDLANLESLAAQVEEEAGVVVRIL